LDRQQWAIGPWADSGMSSVEPRYKRALAALKAIARAIGNTAFRVADYPGSKLAWGKRSFPSGKRVPAQKRRPRSRITAAACDRM
jgi:hypothetical protein